MAIALARFSQWMLRGDEKHKHKHKQRDKRSGGFRESEPIMVNFWHGTSRTRRVDRDHDMVIVPSDGGACISGSESDGSDWSIGWLEPHPHGFCTSDAESEDSFAVLVPCYRPLPLPARATANPLLHTRDREGLSVSESNEFLQHWLASLASDPLV